MKTFSRDIAAIHWLRIRPVRILLSLMFLSLVAGCADKRADEASDVAAPAVIEASPGAQKQVITRRDDLPRHTYQLDIPASQLYEPENREILLALASALKEDVEADLAAYDIQDNNTLQGFYADLGSVALLEGRYQDYLDLLEKRRDLEAKGANRLTMGVLGEAVARVGLERPEDPSAFIADYLAQRYAAMPYALVQDSLKQSKGRTEYISRALVLGSIQSGVEPVLEKTGGEMSYDIASRLVGTSFTIDSYLPIVDTVNAVLTDIIAANQVEKPNIWAERDVALQADADAQTALIAVWDSGADISLFPAAQLWRNDGEVPDNNRDDDKNGYVDDVHGIGWSLHADPVRELLYPIGEMTTDSAELERQSKGLSDIVAAVDSPEATALRKKLSNLEQDKVEEFLESLQLYGNYSHGTHVSGIALAGNPFARLLTVRVTFGHTIIPEKPTLEQTLKDAEAYAAVVAYLKAQGVRAVNMSWGGSLAGIEAALEAHDVGDTPEDRKALARRYYDIVNDALRGAIADSPEILFITSAGNSDNDVKFDEFYPSSYELPNILSVGAVDQAGQETSFTSLGKVDIYANGFEVDSYVPGGNRQKLSGTSMASPQVLNLAGKLLALSPSLTMAELRDLILQGSDAQQLEEREIRLLNPKASLTLLQQRQTQS